MTHLLFAVMPAIAPTAPAAVVTPSLAPTTLLDATPFAVLLGHLVEPNTATVELPVSRNVEVNLDDFAEPLSAEWVAMMTLPLTPPMPSAPAVGDSPAPAVAAAAPLLPITVEQAIAAAVTPLGVGVQDVAIESIEMAPSPATRVAAAPQGADIAPAAELEPTDPSTAIVLPLVDPADVIYRDASLLQPEFRARLERVVKRMTAEHGREVVIRETFRSQARQDVLFAQGRTAPGPVVTWTRRSLHTDGLAADLQIMGASDSPVVYEQLATIAVGEGLFMLGPQDPGHVELRTPFPTAVVPKSARPTTFNPAFGRRTTFPVIEVPQGPAAPVAARPAPVASVVLPSVPDIARVARPDAPPASTPESDWPTERPVDSPTAAVPGSATPLQFAATPTLTTVEGPQLARRAAPTQEQPGLATNIGARIEDIQSIADVMADRPVTGVVLRLDGDAGNGDRIRIDVRRNVVDASMQATDPSLGTRLTSDTHTLRSALERQGLEVGALDVRTTNVGTSDNAFRGSENRRENGASSEQHRRQSPDARHQQRQRRSPNQNGESPR